MAATSPFAPTLQPEHFGTGVRAARPQKLLGQGARTLPKNGFQVSHAEDEAGEKYDYVDHGSKSMSPTLPKWFKIHEALNICKTAFAQGKDQLFHDYDGPKLGDGTPTCEEATLTDSGYVEGIHQPHADSIRPKICDRLLTW